jgi:competence protein ComEA
MDAAAPEPAPPPFRRLHPEQAALAVLALSALALLFTHGLNALRGSCRPVELHEALTLDLNEAPAAALVQVPGIGPGAAERIIAERDRAGFRGVDELTRVSGIKNATLEKVRPWLTVRTGGGEAAPPTAPAKAAPKSGLSKKERDWTGPPLDVNAAPPAELLRIPFVGPKTAQKIIAERERAPFANVDDLRRVFGAKTLERVRPYVRVGETLRVAAGR